MNTLHMLGLVVVLGSQLLQNSPEFAAATIKPTRTTSGSVRRACHGTDSLLEPQRAQVQVSLGRCVFESAALDYLILVAYSDDLSWIRSQPPHSVVHGGPAWVHTDRFDLEAVADSPLTTSRGDLHRMLQTLLADRFRLKLHRQFRETKGYALVSVSQRLKVVPAKDTTIAGQNRLRRMTSSPGEVALSGRNVSMAMLCDHLTSLGLGPVIDKTGLDGTYDFSLNYAVDELSGTDRKLGSPSTPSATASAPSMFTALREQLGLELRSEKVSREYLMIEAAEKPTPN